MAQPPATSDAFLREVDDELRRDRLAAAWRRWGRIAIVAVLVGLAVFAGWLVWQGRAETAAGVEGEQLQDSYDKIAAGQGAQAQSTLAALAQSHRDGYRALALLTQGDLLAAKDPAGAAAKYGQVADDASLGQPFRDLALIRQTTLRFDTLPPQQVIERLRPLAAPGNPWFGSAGELVAVAYLKQGRRDLAGRLFGQIARADDVPQSLRQRAVQMASLMGAPAAAAAAAPQSGADPKP